MPGSPRRKHKHKHRSRSRSPRPKERHRKKRSHDDSEPESDHEVKKHHKHKHHSHNTSDSEEESRPQRHRGQGSGREDRERPPRVKQEPDDREHQHRHRHIKREPGQVKQEPDSDNDDRRQRQHFDRQRRDRRRQQGNRFQGNDNASDEQQQFGRQGGAEGSGGEEEEPVEKEKPNFELSGKLTEETNTYKGVVIKYSEPPEARKPKKRWRLYPFKDGTAMPVWHIHRQSAYLMGRDRKIVDIPIDHPSCSKQHSVLQYRLVPYQKDNGITGHAVRPYIIDLGSTNGTHVNNQRIEAQRYVQLLEKDVLKFGFSSREYVLLHDASKGPEPEDDEGESD